MFLFVLLLCSACSAAEFVVIHDRTGKVNCIQRQSDKACIPFDPDNSDYQRFLEWNAKQPMQDRVVVADRAPDPIPAQEIERQRRLQVALSYIKAIPDAWENGTNDQKLMWAVKQALKELRDNTD